LNDKIDIDDFLARLRGKFDADELLFCDYKECPNRGDVLTCYFDKYITCKDYKKEENGISR
jgi:hypothetical protein